MRRRAFIKLGVGSAVVWPLYLRAQQRERLTAWLTSPCRRTGRSIVKQRLNELGYSEGKNLISTFAPPKGNRSSCLSWPPNLWQQILM